MVRIAYAGDGESVFDLFFLNHLIKKNDVYLLTFSEAPYKIPENVRVIKMREPFRPQVSPLKGLYTYAASFLRSMLLKRQLNTIKPSALISSGALSYGFYSALSSYSPNILLVWGSDVLTAPKSFLFRFIAKYTLSKANVVVADGDAEGDACISLGYDGNKIVKFPWIDLRPILREAEKNAASRKMRIEEFREKIGWLKDDPVVISTRHHEPVYDVKSLILAVPYIVKEVKNARFLILSSGSLTATLKKRVHELEMEDNVKFLGKVPHIEIPRYLLVSDIYVSTSLSDGTSASLLEAMACKLPPIVTNLPANREWVKDGKNGVLVPLKDPESLAQNVIKLLKDENLRKSLGLRAYEFVLDKVDWEKNSGLLDNIISHML